MRVEWHARVDTTMNNVAGRPVVLKKNECMVAFCLRTKKMISQ